MNYFIRYNKHVKCYFDNEVKEVHMGIYQFVESLCQTKLFDKKGYLKCCIKEFGFKKNVPIVISDRIILIIVGNIRDLDVVIINYSMIKILFKRDEKTEVLFQNGESIYINKKISFFENQIKRIESIKSFLE